MVFLVLGEQINDDRLCVRPARFPGLSACSISRLIASHTTGGYEGVVAVMVDKVSW